MFFPSWPRRRGDNAMFDLAGRSEAAPKTGRLLIDRRYSASTPISMSASQLQPLPCTSQEAGTRARHVTPFILEG